jgi:hypothetical protein
VKHFHSLHPYEDFVVIPHADETISISGLATVRESESIEVQRFGSEGTLVLSDSAPCPHHPMRRTRRSPNEFSKVLVPAGSDEPVGVAHYRLSVSKQAVYCVIVELKAATCSMMMMFSRLRSRLPVSDQESKDQVRYRELNGFTIHSHEVFSIAYKCGYLPNLLDRASGASPFVDEKHEFYYWQDKRTLTRGPSEITSINLAVDGQPDDMEGYRNEGLWKCFGDETFLVKCYKNGIEIYCFDKDFASPVEYHLYRKERDQRAEKRSEGRMRYADQVKQS